MCENGLTWLHGIVRAWESGVFGAVCVRNMLAVELNP